MLTSDDMTVTRGVERPAARDNVLFELGLFIGALGRERTYMLYDRTNPPSLPTDLAGIVPALFQPRDDGDLLKAVARPCYDIRRHIERLGLRPDRALRNLQQATTTVEAAGASVQKLIRLLAESRVLEMDVFTQYFGGMIGPGELAEVKRN
ncbi:hypothetical protein SGFS_034630 [Streptomyces graminofaciens]|uniref:CD-NTase-associated protein 12/Pycsar effector protein TIR domain-containing protein n=1 Tax=Streptomyces graminofaciens TaxID=68212 RepID=A0ABN5VGB4_9ACTN|nr:hypothetical protein SGFS_034630 [Streptomyces graminofaciens]